MRQTLIAVDGASGIGKDTFIDHLVYRLKLDITQQVIKTTEPTEKFYGDRALLRLTRGHNDLETTMLMLLDRANHIEFMQKEYQPDAVVIMNRYGLSTLAYQKEEHRHIIATTHRMFPTPDITIVLDAPHKLWLKCNRAWFAEKYREGDRGSYRDKLKNEQDYSAIRQKYLKDHPVHMVGYLMVVDAFRDEDVMVDEVMPTIIKAISGGLLPIRTVAERDAIFRELTEKVEVVGSNPAANKVAMTEAERCIRFQLEKEGSFATEDIISSLVEYPVGRIMGNVIQRLLNRGAIKPANNSLYQKGPEYRDWVAGL